MVGKTAAAKPYEAIGNLEMAAQADRLPVVYRAGLWALYRRFSYLSMAIVLIFLGFALFGFLFYWLLTSPRIIRVPEGRNPLPYFSTWRDQRLSKKLPRWFWVVAGLALGMIISGAVVAILLGGNS